ncbi:hypothetical protein GIY62_14650 [Burkholderia plantarii]|uniref:hypothetical protein n=1 Tax=Burkholderia plantarii TaxID=41899 RepID=UPI00272BBE65|nr:hypothetical protein [Burkholderia plantarii]WLE58366.1 hypothetical protein GIY62_14650 [Burkholderia plantarii]
MADKRSATLVVKVRPEIRDWLAEVADQQFRTVSAEVCMRLERDYQLAMRRPASAGVEAAPNV